MSAHSNDSIASDDSSFDVDKQSSTTRTKENESSESEQKEKFVQQESRYVLLLRLSVIAVLLLAAVAVCVLVYLITSKGETDAFQSHYNAVAQKITDTFMGIVTDNMGAAGSLVVATVAEGQSRKKMWPFVTLSSFQERAATVMRLSGTLYVGMNPLVHDYERAEWEAYSTSDEDAGWYQEARAYEVLLGFDQLDNRAQIQTDDPELNVSTGIANHIYDFDREIGGLGVISPYHPYYLPVWQTSPVTHRSIVNQNRASNSEAAQRCLQDDVVAFEGMQRSNPGYGTDPNPVTAETAWLLRIANRKPTMYDGDIVTVVYFPLYDTFIGNRTTVGVMRNVIHWARFFRDALPDSSRGVMVVLENGCDEPFTYRIDGADVIPIGNGDLHDHSYNDYERNATFADVNVIEDGTAHGLHLHQGNCTYSIRVYPSTAFYDTYNTNTPLLITFAVACVFVFTVIMFFLYDRLVERRQLILMRKATQTHKIVASLFPKSVRDRLLQEGNDKKNGVVASSYRLTKYLNGTEDDGTMNQAPIADLFPQATVLFTDIAGFTAWSSSREPAQVFELLESLYHAFDKVAKQRKVFKVETIGDSYVAVTGVPEPQEKHAVIMARFASECQFKMTEVTRNLAKTLGPDTAELSMRVGMNSGPVTAGVLRGERSRFQLFGDTMNTASRMESTGVPGKIQVTKATADLLIQAGKEHWVIPRQDSVIAKGKGVLQTFWISPCVKKGTSQSSSETASSAVDVLVLDETEDANAEAVLKQERQIDWMVELLLEKIRLIVAHRQAKGVTCKAAKVPAQPEGHIALDEVVEAIKLPDFNDKSASADASSVEIDEEIADLLREYVAIIASAYQNNPFHNFEHACHVTMSVSKFLKRIVTPEMEIDEIKTLKDENKIAKCIASHLHDYTHGINSDPITLFGLVFSALIHDVDHRGVSNAQLMKEETNMAQLFRNKSIAEQNSLAISWDLLLSERFNALRDYIFADTEELARFRQVIVNVVLATDIFDKELNDLRKERWGKAFAETMTLTPETNALRATIVMEHIMQASDVCHTMQHWHIYRKWNQKLFFELTKAHREDRMGVDPADFWYKGELGFFDNYIIPLANKLKDCNVFGVSSDECLNFALRNRAEWEDRGEEIVSEMLQELRGAEEAEIQKQTCVDKSMLTMPARNSSRISPISQRAKLAAQCA